MFSFLAGILAFFYQLIPNYAVAISLLTLTVMLVLTPFTLKGTRSMLAMQKLQPEMKRIQEMHKGDRQAQNEAMMAFYKEHKINPLAGCLPMLLQFPVLIVMFRVIRGITHTATVAGATVAKPSYIGHDTDLYKALAKSHGKMVSFGVDFAKLPSKAGSGAFVLYLLIAAVVATGYYQVRQMQSRTANQQQINPQAQMMTKIMPLFSGLISLSLPGGVTLYFLVSNLFRIAQQSLMYKFDPALASHLAEVKDVRSRAATQPAPKAQPSEPRKGLFGSLMAGGASKDNGNGSNGNGSNGKVYGSSPGNQKDYSSGRVTPSGQQANRSRKRSKKKR